MQENIKNRRGEVSILPPVVLESLKPSNIQTTAAFPIQLPRCFSINNRVQIPDNQHKT